MKFEVINISESTKINYINKRISETNLEYIFIVNEKDYIGSEFFNYCEEEFKKGDNCGLIYCNFQSGLIFKKELVYHIGFLNEIFDYAWLYDFIMRTKGYYKIIEYSGDLVSIKEHEISEHYKKEKLIIDERYNLMFQKGRPTVCAMVCMKNEELFIDRFLNDLVMYIDKIVIFDDGSIDKSSEMIKKWKKVEYILRQKPKGNIRTEGADRKKLLESAYWTNSEWFLFIDCDEIFEDNYKTEIFKEINNKDVNLWFYNELNFWNGEKYLRIDTLFDKGLFGRLFRVSPNLKYNPDSEHCCGIPNNIPDAPPWFCHGQTTKQRISSIGVKHYGFCNINRLIKKVGLLWERDTVSIPVKFERYERLIDETNLKLKEYKFNPYYENKIDGNEFLANSFEKSSLLKQELEYLKKNNCFKDYNPPKKIKENIIIVQEKKEDKSNEILKELDFNKINKDSKILIIGNGNCFRSQFIQSLLNQKGFLVESCGINHAKSIHPRVIDLLKECGAEIKDLSLPKPFRKELLNLSDYIISLVELDSTNIKNYYKWDIEDGTIENIDKLRNSLNKINERI